MLFYYTPLLVYVMFLFYSIRGYMCTSIVYHKRWRGGGGYCCDYPPKGGVPASKTTPPFFASTVAVTQCCQPWGNIPRFRESVTRMGKWGKSLSVWGVANLGEISPDLGNR